MSVPLTELSPGTRVHFAGGTGRDDVTVMHAGVVNGPIMDYPDQGVVYVPVYVVTTDQCVMVCAENITEVVFDDAA